MRRIALLFISMFFVGCGSGGFSDHLAFQNMVAAGARKPSGIRPAVVSEDLYLEFRRGAATSTFEASLSEGVYPAILETDQGVFFLSEWGGFLYEMNGEPQSVIGGIFLRSSDKKPFVWFIPRQGTEEEWRAWLAGDRVEKVKPGITNAAFRPWVEADFNVPVEAVSIE